MLFKRFTKKVIIYFLTLSFIFFANCALAKDDIVQKISIFSIDLTEVSINKFRKFIKTTDYITEPEKRG